MRDQALAPAGGGRLHAPCCPFRDQAFTSVASLYERIGQAYGVPMFSLLGSTMRRMDDKGLSPRSVLTNLARAVGPPATSLTCRSGPSRRSSARPCRSD